MVVLDNLGAHKGKRVRKLIEDRGAGLLFLPTYSPDLNPIEKAFSKIKTLLKKAAARTREALVEAIGEALLAVTPQDVVGWLAHCGYGGHKAQIHDTAVVERQPPIRPARREREPRQ